ncbi:hypothetical protein [Demequina activiva]|uniref:Flavodoxin n=1 Tax=Demequina activiva TaxID=1582364 RepID=A0A919UGS1_9MICO|nr:hypothetical protein [Demequina activiva]GIG55137.1 hypothetical protein Dac01nite_18890 [Demequina activiva]
MDAVVVYESMWGNTSTVARAIAAGLGRGTQALATDAATPAAIGSCRLVVAGAPVHAMGLPTDTTRASAAAKRQGVDGLSADLGHPPLRDWLEGLAAGPRLYAAFETRIRGPLGRGAVRGIARAFEEAGWAALDEPRGFTVALTTRSAEPAALLLPGQEEAAHRWGEHLRHLLVEAEAEAASPS